jgi:hypothetical protein
MNFMDKTLKNIINKTIEREFGIVMEKCPEHLKKDPELIEYDAESSQKLNKAMHELYELLPKEKHYLVDDFESAATALMSIEARVAFKEGLILGLTELKYLGEVGQEIAFI